MQFRVGLGTDLHRLGRGGTLRLGGVVVAEDRHAEGHSDADALLHAVTDALLGAAALGDIGTMFPDTEAQHRGRDSAEMLALAWQHIQAAGWQLMNLDCVVHLERPKLAPHRDAIRRRIADILDTSPECIGVKAKTGEGLDAVGREQAVAAQCVALLLSDSHIAGAAAK